MNIKDDDRPDPDSLLSSIQQTEKRSNRGRLKIFLGMAAGVGKTFEMLSQAHRLQKAGTKVLVGVVETHGRTETAALIEGLEVLPKKALDYRGAKLQEMDLDGIIRAKPNLVLVDELAHTNAPGSRHEKRYQDVLEILDAGIDVFTTINIQHIESRKDTIQQITGVMVRESVPDSLLDRASDIELIDLPPDALLQRLAEGKVYIGEAAERAQQNFFQRGNLTALRELSLRLTAERVDHELRDYVRQKKILGPLKTSERLMVAVGASPSAEQLIRWTRRTAYNLEAPWIAVYIETGQPLKEDDREVLKKNMQLVEELGGEIVTTSDVDITRALLRVAHQRNVTQIVVGKPNQNYLSRLMGDSSPVNRLIKESGSIDVYVVHGGIPVQKTIKAFIRSQIHSTPRDYAIALFVMTAVIAACLALQAWMGYTAVGLTLVFSVLALGLFSGRGPILVSAIVAAVLWNYLFILPHYNFRMSKAEDVLVLAVFFMGAVVTSALASRSRAREKAFRSREEHATALYDFSADLSQTRNLSEIVERICESLGGIFTTDIAVTIRGIDGNLAAEAHKESKWIPELKEMVIAQWAFRSKKMSGRFTDTLREAEGLHIPLLSGNDVVGVLSLRPRRSRMISVDELSLLDTFAHSAAIAIQKEIISEEAVRLRSAEESERLHKTLLNSISHELRTPIMSISGAVGALRKKEVMGDDRRRGDALEEIEDGAERLNRLVENLLDMSRLESGHLKMKIDKINLKSLLTEVIAEIDNSLYRDRIKIYVENDVNLKADYVLTAQCLHNLIDNALIYTPAATPVEISAKRTAKGVEVRIEDRGLGLAQKDLTKIFEKFYRPESAPPGGTGLGLSICKGFMEAQGGTVRAENRSGGGLSLVLEFPEKD